MAGISGTRRICAGFIGGSRISQTKHVAPCSALTQGMLEHNNQALEPEKLFSIFGEQLKGIGKMLMCFDKLKECAYPKRIWCIFEVFTATHSSFLIAQSNLVLSLVASHSLKPQLDHPATTRPPGDPRYSDHGDLTRRRRCGREHLAGLDAGVSRGRREGHGNCRN